MRLAKNTISNLHQYCNMYSINMFKVNVPLIFDNYWQHFLIVLLKVGGYTTITFCSTGAKFIKLLNRKYCLANFYAKQTIGSATFTNMHYWLLAGYQFLLSNIFLCLASFCAYRLYEIGSCTRQYHMAQNANVNTKFESGATSTPINILTEKLHSVSNQIKINLVTVGSVPYWYLSSLTPGRDALRNNADWLPRVTALRARLVKNL